MSFSQKIRDIPDFPQPGVLFKDITTLLKDAEAYKQCIDFLYERFRDERIDKVVGPESRAFLLGGPLAYLLGAGYVPARKPGKLPAQTIRAEYSLEYGTNVLEMHEDAITAGEQVLIVDDLLATGGTICATIDLVRRLRGEIVGLAFLIELEFLHGRERLSGHRIESLIKY